MSSEMDSDFMLRRWQKQIGDRRPYRRRRPFAALGFLYRPEASEDTLIELRKLTIVLLFDEPIGRPVPALRLVGYGGTQVPHGISWGGAENCRFHKDLRIAPEYGGSGLQIDSSNARLVHLALQLQSTLYRTDRYFPRRAQPTLILPRVWAGFTPDDAQSVVGEGPELLELSNKFDLEPTAMLQKFERVQAGLRCYPVDWVGSALPRSLAMFADLSNIPNKQVFHLPSIAEGLQGYSGAASFDFFNSKQREHFEMRLKNHRFHAAPQEVTMEVEV